MRIKRRDKRNNYVAKYAKRFNKSVTMRDKKNDYQRQDKHKKIHGDTE
jgi:hypothetical protein